MRGRIKMDSGHSRRAWNIGMADLTPLIRAM
jgi:hypothetical protein